jgi:acetyltransferase-like isoleucine patch superfamily enzyme
MLFKFQNLIVKIFNYIYSGVIKIGFKYVGKNFKIQFPLNVIGGDRIEIGDNFRGFSRIRIEAYSKHQNNYYDPRITIGHNVSINYDCHIGCVNKIVIGNGVLIASKVFITDHFHGGTDKIDLLLPPSSRKVISKGPVIIEDNVWIGEGVCIMPNVIIGENSIIGANAVVTKSFPSNSIIVGNPARLLRRIE